MMFELQLLVQLILISQPSAAIQLDEFIPLSVADVVRLVKDSPTKACGLDPIPTWLVKDFAQLLAPYLTNLFNRSLSQGYFPEIFRLAEVTPILKKSTLDPSVLSSYRPISNLPFVSKVLERAVNERMSQHLQSNGLLPENQSAYRRSHSTETALLKVTSDALIAADQGRLAHPAWYAWPQCRLRLCGSRHPPWPTRDIVRILRSGTRLDAIVPRRKEAVCEIQWVYLLSNRDAVRRSSGFRTWPIVFRSLHCRCVSNCWGAGVLRPWICRWSADLWSLPCQWHAPAHQSTYSLHRDRGPLDVKQPPEAESIEDRIHLAGFDTSSG